MSANTFGEVESSYGLTHLREHLQSPAPLHWFPFPPVIGSHFLVSNDYSNQAQVEIATSSCSPTPFA